MKERIHIPSFFSLLVLEGWFPFPFREMLILGREEVFFLYTLSCLSYKSSSFSFFYSFPIVNNKGEWKTRHWRVKMWVCFSQRPKRCDRKNIYFRNLTSKNFHSYNFCLVTCDSTLHILLYQQCIDGQWEEDEFTSLVQNSKRELSGHLQFFFLKMAL